MKILIVSDTHQREFLNLINQKEKNIDIYLHAGDSSLNEFYIYPFISVKGNTDYYDFGDLYSFTTPYGRLLMKHLPFYQNEIEEYYKEGFKIFINGHTHARLAEKLDNGIYLFNPGSLFFPRDGKKGCYLLLNIDKDKIEYEFKEIE